MGGDNAVVTHRCTDRKEYFEYNCHMRTHEHDQNQKFVSTFSLMRVFLILGHAIYFFLFFQYSRGENLI